MNTKRVRVVPAQMTYHMPDMLALEHDCFPDQEVDEAVIKRRFLQKSCVTYLAFDQEDVLGFMFLQFFKKEIFILRIGVYTPLRRFGVGSMMVHKLKGRELMRPSRTRIAVAVGEDDIESCMFFSACGFLAVQAAEAYNGLEYIMTYDTERKIYSPNMFIHSNQQLI